MKADMVLEDLRVLHIHLQATGSDLCCTLGVPSASEISRAKPTVTPFLQQGHTYSNKATPHNSATPSGGHFLSDYHSEVGICVTLCRLALSEKFHVQRFQEGHK